MEDYDFSGWATRNNIVCADGRIIRQNAFEHDNGKVVPLVWNHQHNSPLNVVGQVVLENRPEGVYAYGKFNDTEGGKTSKVLLEHGDITALSIMANQLKQQGANVIHGVIREVSLVMAGANPGATIESVIRHGVASEEDAIIFTDEEISINQSELSHANDKEDKKEETKGGITVDEKETKNQSNDNSSSDNENASKNDKTVGDVLEGMTEEQQNVTYYLVGKAIDGEADDNEDDEQDSEGGNNSMKHNVFDMDEQNTEGVLTHADQTEILKLAKTTSVGSLRDAMEIYTAQEQRLAHGIDDIETLFPDYKDVRPGAPEMVTRDLTWVDGVMAGVNKVPFQRIRTRQADVRGNDLRAFGYQKGKFKQQPGNIKLLKRTTDPQTVYRKDALHRDDIIDITDFDIVEYQYQVMRQNLNEELAMAIMIGDGREEGDEMKIYEDKIRPIWTDDDLYTIHYDVDIEGMKSALQGSETSQHFGENYIYAEAIIQSALYAREKYKGSGSLEFYCTPHLLNVMLLARDLNGRRIYSSVNDLAAALNVTRIHTAEQFENKTRTAAGSKTKKLLGLFVNLKDYSVGSVRGGEITRFNQFDIDFNQEKYLIETRLSGALTRVYSAIALEEDITE